MHLLHAKTQALASECSNLSEQNRLLDAIVRMQEDENGRLLALLNAYRHSDGGKLERDLLWCVMHIWRASQRCTWRVMLSTRVRVIVRTMKHDDSAAARAHRWTNSRA